MFAVYPWMYRHHQFYTEENFKFRVIIFFDLMTGSKNNHIPSLIILWFFLPTTPWWDIVKGSYADFGEQQHWLPSKDLQTKHEWGFGCSEGKRNRGLWLNVWAAGVSCGGGCFLSTHWAPNTPPLLASLTLARCETFIFAASCAAARYLFHPEYCSIRAEVCRQIPCWSACKAHKWHMEVKY